MPTGIHTDCKLVDLEFDRQFGHGAPVVSRQAQEHLDECERCRSLYRYFREGLPAVSVSQELQHRVVKTIRGSLKPVSSLRPTPVIVAQLLGTFLLVSAVVSGVKKGVGIDAMDARQLIGMSLILALGGALLSFSLAWQMKPGSLQRIGAGTAVGILAAGLLAGIALLFPWRAPEGFLVLGWRCLRAGLVLALGAAFVFGFLVRRGAALNMGTLGGTVGAIAGLLGMTVLQFTCDLQDRAHLLVWHAGVLVLSTLGGWLIGQSVSRLSARLGGKSLAE